MANNLGAVLVTGASSGLGEATALGLAGAGFTVYAGVRSETSAARVKREHPAIRPVILDVTSAESVSAAGRVVREQTDGGGLVGLVNNAGICVSAPLECVPLDDLRAELEVNLVGALAVTQELLPLLRVRSASTPAAAPAGRIVNISSGAGLRASRTGIQAYTSAKHAVVGLTRQLAQELGPFGITANAVAPGLFAVSPGTVAQWEGYGPEGQGRVVEGIALRRMGEAQDIANAVMFFASDLAGYVSGQVLPVNGGSF